MLHEILKYLYHPNRNIYLLLSMSLVTFMLIDGLNEVGEHSSCCRLVMRAFKLKKKGIEGISRHAHLGRAMLPETFFSVKYTFVFVLSHNVNCMLLYIWSKECEKHKDGWYCPNFLKRKQKLRSWLSAVSQLRMEQCGFKPRLGSKPLCNLWARIFP